MKSCRKCFEYAYVFVGGDVRICPWNGIVIGNLLENTLEEIWAGEKAEEIREAFMRGELLGCNEEYCPDCINKSTTLELTAEELDQLYQQMPDCPTIISLAYDERCNHACPSCRSGFFQADQEYKDKLKKITANIEPYLKNVKSIATNGIGELFLSTEILNMLSRLYPKDPEFSIFIESNGVLFKDNWDKIKHLKDYHITVSVTPNSFDRETYKYLNGRDDLEKFEESLSFISQLKQKGHVNRIRIIMVIQDSNFRQIPQFIQKCIDYDADDIVLRPIFPWFGLQEDERLYKNVLNPCHLYHKEYLEIIKHPLCQDPRVFNWGFVEEQEPIEFPTLEMARLARGERQFEQTIDCALPDIWEKIDNFGKKVVLYGAGKIGRLLFEKLTSGDKTADIAGFAVTDDQGQPNYLLGVPVLSLEKYAQDTEQYVFLLATINIEYRGQMEEQLRKLGIASYIQIQ